MVESVPPGRMRISDADRTRVAEQLRVAQNEGWLDLAEYDERIQAAYRAKTVDELGELTLDLPSDMVSRRPRPQPSAGADVACRDDGALAQHGRWQRGVVGAWLTASLVNVVIWFLVSVTTGAMVYPWWIWVAGPWGAVILAGWLGSRGRGARG